MVTEIADCPAGPQSPEAPQSSQPGAHPLSRRRPAMLPDAHFLPRAEAECLKTWRRGETSESGESPSQITSQAFVCPGLPGPRAKPALSPSPHSSQAAPAQCPNHNPSDASREADPTDWPLDQCLLCLHLSEATKSHPAPLPEQPLGAPSPLTLSPHLTPPQAPMWWLQSDPPRLVVSCLWDLGVLGAHSAQMLHPPPSSAGGPTHSSSLVPSNALSLGRCPCRFRLSICPGTGTDSTVC